MAFESIIKNPKVGTKTGSEVSDHVYMYVHMH